MSRVLKLIWRLDFKASYSYIDKRGTALNILSNTVEDFWKVVGDGAQHMSFVGRTADDVAFRNCSIEPTNMNGLFEFGGGGLELDRVLQSGDFRSVDRITKELLKLYEVKSVVRAGLRLICVSPYAPAGGGSFPRFMQKLGKANFGFVGGALGDATDVGLTYEGQDADKVKYRAQFGPYHRKNSTQYLERTLSEEEFKILDNNDLIFDIDLYEHDISFVELSLFRWANTKIAKAEAFVTAASKAFPVGA